MRLKPSQWMLALLLISHFALIGGLLWWCGAAIGLLLVLPLLAWLVELALTCWLPLLRC